MSLDSRKQILAILDSFPDSLKPISIQGKRYIDNNSNISGNVLNILHRPWIAPMNWGLMLYSKASINWFDDFESKTGKTIPPFYKEFLSKINGGFIYGMTLYGLPPSKYTTGLLTRSILQCHDLTSANTSWIREYNINQNLFYFGGREFSPDENIGYFSDNDKILCYRKNGELINEWDNFKDMLEQEIAIVEKVMLEELPKDYKLMRT